MSRWIGTSHAIGIGDRRVEHTISSILPFAAEPIFRNLLDSISDGVLLLGKKGEVVYLNHEGAHILGLAQDSVVGKNVTEIVDFRPVILDVLESGQGYNEREFVINSPSRGRLHFMKSAIVMRDKSDSLLGVIDMFRLIDSKRNMMSRTSNMKVRFTFDDIIGREPVFLDALQFSRIAAQSDANVLIEGESGTGKELFAHAIHHASARKSGPFVIVNCATLPPSLIESELFGYESGSFTGATKEGFAGKFEQANGGTIFLDEIAEIPLEMQAKLLRVLQDATFTRIGGRTPITADTRVIAATNKRLLEETRAGTFREDLYYRLNVLCVRTPSLRERQNDIPLLTRHFIRKIALKHAKPVPEVDSEVLRILRDFSWPGNVRELENVIERAMLIAPSNRITVEQLPKYILEAVQHNASGERREQPVPPGHPEAGIAHLEDVEKKEIERALKECNGNMSRCAKLLGIHRNTLYRKLERYNT